MEESEFDAVVTWRDYAWSVVALLAALALLSRAVESGLLFGAVMLLAGFWVVAGAWRRTVWGCPFSHDAEAEVACPRHQGRAQEQGTDGPRVRRSGRHP